QICGRHYFSFECRRAKCGGHPDRCARLPFRMLRDAAADLPRQIQPTTLVFEHIDNPQALLVMVESSWHERVDDPLSGVTEGRVAQIVAERDGFGQLFVKSQHFCDRACDLRHLERMRQPCAVVIAGRCEEYLCLVLEPPE